jgi:hypothetical protein
MTEENAAIALFCFNNLGRTRRTVESLQKNALVNCSDLIVFCDGPRSTAESIETSRVRDYVKSIRGFRNLKVVESETNKGLADSIVGGLNAVFSKNESCIVLEDDVEVSPVFLEYMNSALRKYQDDKRVWHVNGYNVPWSFAGCSETFCSRWMSCWGWGTWRDRWKEFRREPERLVREWRRQDIRYMNINGTVDFWEQVLRNNSQQLKTWAIFWQATIQERKGLCISPRESFCRNFGFEGDGTNCGRWSAYDLAELSEKMPVLVDVIREDKVALARLQGYFRYHNPTLLDRVVKRLRRLVGR